MKIKTFLESDEFRKEATRRFYKILKILSVCLKPTSPVGGQRLCEEAWSWVEAWSDPQQEERLSAAPTCSWCVLVWVLAVHHSTELQEREEEG